MVFGRRSPYRAFEEVPSAKRRGKGRTWASCAGRLHFELQWTEESRKRLAGGKRGTSAAPGSVPQEDRAPEARRQKLWPAGLAESRSLFSDAPPGPAARREPARRSRQRVVPSARLTPECVTFDKRAHRTGCSRASNSVGRKNSGERAAKNSPGLTWIPMHREMWAARLRGRSRDGATKARVPAREGFRS